MSNKDIQDSRSYKQINNATPDVVFPLLCPVRERDWIDGWKSEILFSKSGLIEEGCVFITGEEKTVWYVTKYDKINYKIEFVRFTPGEWVVKINISLLNNGDGTTTSDITYQYTALNEANTVWIRNKFDQEFTESMKLWEKAINHYIKTGKKLLKTS